MRNLTLLILAFAPLTDFAQYRTLQDSRNVEIYGMELHVKRNALRGVMDVVGASGMVSYFILKEKYESNNLSMLQDVPCGSALLLATGPTVPFASLSKKIKAGKRKIHKSFLMEVATAEERQSQPMIYGLDQFKAANKTAWIFDALGASGIIGYFIWKGTQKHKMVDHLVSMERVGEDYLLRMYAVHENGGKRSVLMKE